MVEGGWHFKVWPYSDYSGYTATFNALGESELIGHGRTVKKAIKNALKGLGK